MFSFIFLVLVQFVDRCHICTPFLCVEIPTIFYINIYFLWLFVQMENQNLQTKMRKEKHKIERNQFIFFSGNLWWIMIIFFHTVFFIEEKTKVRHTQCLSVCFCLSSVFMITYYIYISKIYFECYIKCIFITNTIKH